MIDSPSAPGPLSKFDPFTAAEWISIALVPPTISALVFLFLVIDFQHGSIPYRVLVWIVAVVFSGVLQIIYVLYLRKQGKVSAYDVPERLERTGPYMLSVLMSIVGLLGLVFLQASVYILALMWCFAFNTALLTLMNRYWKVSAHMMGLTGPLLFLLPVYDYGVIAAVPVIALLGWARVKVKAHTVPQVIAGALAGILLTAIQILVIFRYILPWLDGHR